MRRAAPMLTAVVALRVCFQVPGICKQHTDAHTGKSVSVCAHVYIYIYRYSTGTHTHCYTYTHTRASLPPYTPHA